MLKNVVIIGPAWPLRGGLATFDQRLALQFLREGHQCTITSFSLQYPAFLFPGTTQYSDEPAPESLEINSTINSINPVTWFQTGNRLKRTGPDIIVVRYWLPFMSPALGTILKRAAKNRHTRIIAITDNVIPHEKRPGDRQLTKYFLSACDAFITMSENVMRDLRKFETRKPAIQITHPLYDNFGNAVSKEEAREKLGLAPELKIILFFGFIRKYKGLDILLSALNLIRSSMPDLRLLIAGEYYENSKVYLDLISKLGIDDIVIQRTRFIPDSEVRYYFCAADLVVQPYRNATQSGVTPLAYHFNKPMVVTNVGSLPDMVPHGKSGLVASPDPESIASALRRYFELGENYFIPHLRKEKEKYSWNRLTEAIIKLADDLQK